MAARTALTPTVTNRLGYLLKHAQARFAELNAAALAPFGINGRECAALLAIDDREPLSQQDVADRLGVDRTTMVALIDELQTKGLVQRHPHPDDRRRNVVELTPVGKQTLTRAVAANDEAEREFLSGLAAADAARFRAALQAVVFPTA
jgi:DNA-binding MarR family transcriptional regulator